MKLKLMLILYFVLLLSNHAFGVDVYFAHPYVHSAPNEEGIPYRLSEQAMKIGDTLFREIKQRDHKGLLNLYKSDEEIRSTLDAAQFLLVRKAELMLYGDYYQESLHRATLTMKLYDKGSKENKKVFYVTGHPQEIEAIYMQMAQEIVNYFYLIFDVSNISQEHLYEGFVLTPLVGGIFHLTHYEQFLGIATLGLDLRYRLKPFTQEFPKFPLFTPYFLGSMSYGLSINQPEYYKTLYHQAQFGVGGGVSMELKHRHLFLSDLRYVSEVGILNVNRMHDTTLTQIVHAPGLTINLGYEYWLNNKRVGFGVHNHFNLAFYKKSSPLLTYKLLLSISIALPFQSTLEEERRRVISPPSDREPDRDEEEHSDPKRELEFFDPFEPIEEENENAI